MPIIAKNNQNSARRLGMIMDPIASIKPYKDSSFAVLLEAQKRGWELFFILQEKLSVVNNEICAIAQFLSVTDDNSNWYSLQPEQQLKLSDLDVVFMRKDPPFDMDYIFSTLLLDKLHNAGTLVVNHPQSLRDCNEKIFASNFPECSPATLITSQKTQIIEFLNQQQDIIVKPLDGMGGASIFRIQKSDPNINVIIETMTNFGKKLIMVQAFIPEITQGDKRIILIDGEPVDYALARIPSQGETRANIAAGGTGVGVPLSERDYWICAQIAPELKKRGLLFVGIDVIGDYLTEINVTSPTCIRELDSLYKLNISASLLDVIDKKIAQHLKD
ncbi:Glutathione synthetase [hydrothermal vent metagenome]|uniref:Glutathione synthetase n=1 Tax=hydrothermal vent metagenome TaxID=652676 RepID=A0A3B1A2K5_9ZZZZ